jgi:ribosomal RNA-processing protein 12
MVGALVNMTNDCKRHFRLKTKYLMDRLVRKFGFDVIAEMIPKNDVEMHKRLKNIRKIQARKEKQRAEKGAADSSDEEDDDEGFKLRSKPKTMEEILAESDSESEDDGARPKAVASRKGKMAKSFITEGADSIVDFLDPSAAQQVTAVRPKTAAEKAHLENKKQKTKLGGFSIASDGRIIIKDSDDSDDDDDDEDNDMKDLASDSEDDTEKGKSQETFQSLVASRKRKMGGSVASSRRTAATSTKSEMRYQAGGSGIHRALSGDAGGDNKRRKAEFGSEYRAKKARGDVKLKDRPDPYAYVPLQKSTLNKRKRAKFEGQFKNLVKAAKQGSGKGVKARGNLTKKMKRLNV